MEMLVLPLVVAVLAVTQVFSNPIEIHLQQTFVITIDKDKDGSLQVIAGAPPSTVVKLTSDGSIIEHTTGNSAGSKAENVQKETTMSSHVQAKEGSVTPGETSSTKPIGPHDTTSSIVLTDGSQSTKMSTKIDNSKEKEPKTFVEEPQKKHSDKAVLDFGQEPKHSPPSSSDDFVEAPAKKPPAKSSLEFGEASTKSSADKSADFIAPSPKQSSSKESKEFGEESSQKTTQKKVSDIEKASDKSKKTPATVDESVPENPVGNEFS